LTSIAAGLFTLSEFPLNFTKIFLKFSGGEKELLFQLVEEYTSALECSNDDGNINPRRKHMWRSLTSTFNEISGGLEVCLKCCFETILLLRKVPVKVRYHGKE
jgi:hypothetical protein